MKQDSVITIYLGSILSRTILFKSFLRDSDTAILDDGVTCNQLLVKVGIFILVVIILRQRDEPLAHEVSNQRLGDGDTHILCVVMKVLSEDLTTLFQVIFRQGPECVRPFIVDPLSLQKFLTLMEVKQV